MEPRRTWQVTVKELCEGCNELKSGVEKRKWVDPHWNSTSRFELHSCKDCFDKKVSDQPKHDPYEGYY